MKENSSSPLDVELTDTSQVHSTNQSENKLLHATINRMKAQLAYYEERHNRNRSSPEVLTTMLRLKFLVLEQEESVD